MGEGLLIDTLGQDCCCEEPPVVLICADCQYVPATMHVAGFATGHLLTNIQHLFDTFIPLTQKGVCEWGNNPGDATGDCASEDPDGNVFPGDCNLFDINASIICLLPGHPVNPLDVDMWLAVISVGFSGGFCYRSTTGPTPIGPFAHHDNIVSPCGPHVGPDDTPGTMEVNPQ